ncbi:MAG: NADPH:quinone reductase [Pseudomonadota bacterium]
MRAAYYERTGPASAVFQIGEVDTPRPGPGEVLVRVMASGINPSDTKKRAGWMRPPWRFERVIPHSDGAGVIEAAGSGVDRTRIGERVWLWNAQWGRATGTAAEFVALPAAQAVPLPESVSFIEGACIGIPARTGWCAAQWGKPGPGRHVLVQGGAGAVGITAVAVAAEAGAEVIATVSSDAKATMAHNAGAAHVLRRDQRDLVDAVAAITAGKGVDHIVEVDFGANWQADADMLAPGGTVAAYSSSSTPRFSFDYYAFAAKAAVLRFVQVYLLEPEERAACEAGLAPLLASGRLKPRIAACLPLEGIARAHELQESGYQIGNVVLDLALGLRRPILRADPR